MSRGQYLRGLATQLDTAVETLATPGVLVVPSAARRGRRRASHYRVEQRSLVLIDPDLESIFGDWKRRPAPASIAEFRGWAKSHGATRLGHGFEHLLAGPWEASAWAPQLTVLDGRTSTGIEVVRAMLEDCSEEDLDEAEFEIDALDPLLVGWVEDGRLLALGGGRPEPTRPGCIDIGVLVHPTARRRGLGRSVVAATVDQIVAAGLVPLYRCNSENTGSERLGRSLGFEAVLEIDAFQWPADDVESRQRSVDQRD